MSKSVNQIIPCFNITLEIAQPVRLHCKILNFQEFQNKINSIRCIDYNPERNLFHWYYSDEMLHYDYKIEKKTTNNELWILGKIQVENNEVLILVNSIERAILSLKFFSSKINKTILYFETFDIYNKLLEASEDNQKFYSPIEKFFTNKPIISDNSYKIIVDRVIRKDISDDEGQKLLEQLNKKINSKEKLPEYENFPINLYEDTIDIIFSRLVLKQQLAYEHLKGNTEMTAYELIQNMVANIQNNEERRKK